MVVALKTILALAESSASAVAAFNATSCGGMRAVLGAAMRNSLKEAFARAMKVFAGVE